jgi:hypothetical protein
MLVSNRRLIKSKNTLTTTPAKGVVVSASSGVNDSQQNKISVGSFLGKSNNIENTQLPAKNKNTAKAKRQLETESTAQQLETADGYSLNSSNSINVSSVQISSMLSNLMEAYIPSIGESMPNTVLYQTYRDIYLYDAVAGGAVDMFTNLPFSDFSLAGIKDEKALDPFHQSLQAMRIRKLLGQLSTEYLVNGLFIGEMVFDTEKKIFTGLSPHDPTYAELELELQFGVDPKVTINLGRAHTGNNIAQGAMQRAGIKKNETKNNHTIAAENLLYMTRKGMFKDVRGLSYYKRILPVWFLEKALIRGTIDQAYKRQRSVAHMKVGTPDWTPTSEDMAILAGLLSDAELDPLGAILVTRDGVDVVEVMIFGNTQIFLTIHLP